jgi:hypothetical protein
MPVLIKVTGILEFTLYFIKYWRKTQEFQQNDQYNNDSRWVCDIQTA